MSWASQGLDSMTPSASTSATAVEDAGRKKLNKKQAMIKEELRNIENKIHQVMSQSSDTSSDRDEVLASLFAQREKVGKKLKTMQLNQSRQRRFRERKRQLLMMRGGGNSSAASSGSGKAGGKRASTSRTDIKNSKNKRVKTEDEDEDYCYRESTGEEEGEQRVPGILSQNMLKSIGSLSGPVVMPELSFALSAVSSPADPNNCFSFEFQLASLAARDRDPVSLSAAVDPIGVASSSTWRNTLSTYPAAPTTPLSMAPSLLLSSSATPGALLHPPPSSALLPELSWNQSSLSQLVAENELEFLRLYNNFKKTHAAGNPEAEEEIAVKLLRLRRTFLSDKVQYGPTAARMFTCLQAQRNTSFSDEEKMIMLRLANAER